MGMFSASEVGQIVWIQGKMNAADYIDILQNKMLPFAEDEMSLKWEFMQDNYPLEVSKRGFSRMKCL